MPQIGKDYLFRLSAYLILPVAIMGIIYTYLKLRKKELEQAKLVGLWLIGLILISFIFPWIEHILENQFHRLPLQMDLVRNLRYTIPLLYLFIFWPISRINSDWISKRYWRKIASFAIGTLLICGWGWNANHLAPQFGYVYENIFLTKLFV